MRSWPQIDGSTKLGAWRYSDVIITIGLVWDVK